MIHDTFCEFDNCWLSVVTTL